MTTLKLNKKPTNKPSASRKPVRPIDPSKRNRSIKAKEKAVENNPSSIIDANQPNDDASIKHKPILRSEYPSRVRSNKQPPQQKLHQTNQNRRKKEDREGEYINPPRRGGKARDGFVASEFDKNRATKKTVAKSVAQEEQLPRLSKRMSELGLCSRREADEWIVNGWVKVDGVVIDTLGTRVSPDAEIVVSGYAQEHQAENVTILLHKPVGYVSGQAEDGYQPAIVLVHPDNEWRDGALDNKAPKVFQRRFLKGLAPAGRLDIDSTGLLVLTQDGRIARHLIGHDSSVEKEYLVRVEGKLDDHGLQLLNHGLTLDGQQLKPAKVSWQNTDQLRFVLREGKKRQIRRMCEMVGLHVVGLKRIRIGRVKLGKLPLGQWRYLSPNEKF